ncbi:MAG: hypothetical protein H6867_06380 [Rhodospirillales bacterium]|nr:hypothetical protein [Rhodospirillales bacterium]MCB9995175.1 hypothetical protein [Rhodospirillales bacterium]
MSTPRFFKIPVPVFYRWLRRRHYLGYAALLCCVVLVLPAGIVGGVKLADMIAMNRALAATRALAPEHSALEAISEKERMAYAATLSGLVSSDPDNMYQLIGADFEVMFSAPDLKRAEGRHMVWQYQADGCVLDIYFSASSGQVMHYEVRQRKVAAFMSDREHEDPVEDRACLDEIYRQRAI